MIRPSEFFTFCKITILNTGNSLYISFFGIAHFNLTHMKKITFFYLMMVSFFTVGAQTTIPHKAAQINAALLAASTPLRSGASVYGYNESGEWVELQKGTNELVCIADDPESKGFSVACYHKDLEPFMERGRVLKAEKKSHQEIFDIREEEVKSGTLPMPSTATSMTIYYTNDEANFDAVTGEVKHGNFRYVVYIPFATAASTGLPTSPEVPGMPWIMDPGTHRAHIMNTPPAND